LLHIKNPVTLWSKRAKFPLQFRPGTSDHAVFFQIFVHREYGCLDGIRDASLIIDCGANVGYSSAYFLSRFPNARVVAVEPDPENFAILAANLSPYAGRYRAIRSAVWSHSTGLVLSASPSLGSEWARSLKAASDGEPPTLMATDIGTLFEQSGYDRISILKIDIEGAEAAVFSFNYKSWLTKVDNLVIELHSEECTSIFQRAISAQNFAVSHCGELIVCRRL
jgi:FkbM family methyltransferase